MNEFQKMTVSDRQRRTFSESFKRKKVFEIESKQCRISDICKQYRVSYPAVRKWVEKYGTMKSKEEHLIVESESDTKKLLSQEKRIAELEQVIGQKQLVIDFLQKMIDITEEEYHIDIKKKLDSTPSATTTITGKDVPHR